LYTANTACAMPPAMIISQSMPVMFMARSYPWQMPCACRLRWRVISQDDGASAPGEAPSAVDEERVVNIRINYISDAT
jgi:hypothetical protein